MDFPCFCSIFESCEACIPRSAVCNCVAESDRCPACDWAHLAPPAPAPMAAPPAPAPGLIPPPPPAAPSAPGFPLEPLQECCICLEEVAGPFMACVCQIKTCVECARKNGSSGADLHKCPGCRGMMVYPDGYQPRGTVRAREDDSDSDSDSDGGFVATPARRRRRLPVDGEPACLGIRMLELPQNRLDEVMDRLFLDYRSRVTTCDLLRVLKRRVKGYLKKCQIVPDGRSQHRCHNANRIILKLRGHCSLCRTYIEKSQRSLMQEMY